MANEILPHDVECIMQCVLCTVCTFSTSFAKIYRTKLDHTAWSVRVLLKGIEYQNEPVVSSVEERKKIFPRGKKKSVIFVNGVQFCLAPNALENILFCVLSLLIIITFEIGCAA